MSYVIPRPPPWHVRFGLSWATGTHPVVLMLLAGAVLGPQGLAVVTPPVLGVIDAVIPVAVAALGILAGLEITRPAAPRRWSLLVRANIESLLTGVVVAGGLWFLAPVVLDVEPTTARVVALVAGVCASMSASLPAADPDRLRPVATRLRDLDALAPAVAGALVLAALPSASPTATLILVGQAALLAIGISSTAWLLLSDTSPSTEQRVFSVAALLLVGGIADYLALSALASGLLAGLFWGVVGGVARDCIERDVRYLRHPLMVLMLVTAGARTTLTPAVLALAAAYLLLRVVGKLAGARLAGRGAQPPMVLAPSLLPPGVFGIGFALNAAPMLGPLAIPVLGAVVIGSLGSQVIAAVWRPQEQEE